MLPLYLYIVAGFLLAVTVGRMLIPKIILISKKKRILDMPNVRKVHSSQIPRLGGVAFFPAIMMAYWFVRGLFWQFNTFDAVVPFEDFLFFTTGLMLICIVGITDDISGLSYKCKFVFQVVGALLLVLPYCYIDNLQGLFGLYAIPAWAGVPFTLLLLVALVNAANLIDGVDGLCSGLGVLIFSVLSLLNLLAGNAHLALLGACAVGATLVFFMYNVFGRKLKIFMGDSGSLILGYIAAFLCLQLVVGAQHGHTVPHLTLISLMGVVFVPMADMTRVFAQRILSGKSPFTPDKRHIHHKFLQLGYTHLQCTLMIVLIQAVYIVGNFLLADRVNINVALLINIVAMVVLVLSLNARIRRRERRWL